MKDWPFFVIGVRFTSTLDWWLKALGIVATFGTDFLFECVLRESDLMAHTLSCI